MRIFLSCSKDFYDRIELIKSQLEDLKHVVTPPNGWNDPSSENLIRQLEREKYIQWKAGMIRKNSEMVESHDAILILNFDKNNDKNYIGGAAFLEGYAAFALNKKIFLYNPIPEGSLNDELTGFNPIVISGDLGLIQ